MTGYALITGRVIGPDGLGREGRVEFSPLPPYAGVEESGRRAVVAHYAVARLTANGHLVGHDEERGLRLLAPEVLPPGENNYRVTIDIPGTQSPRRDYLASIVAGATVDLVDIISGRRVEDITSSRARDTGQGLLEAVDPADVIDVGNGLLAWREK